MFHYNDKVTLTAANSVNKDGKITNFNLSFPIKNDNFIVPEDIIQIYIYECTDNSFLGSISFKICVGRTTNLSTLINLKEQFSFLDRDIVVKDTEELKKLLIYISNEFLNIKTSISKIKDFNKRKNSLYAKRLRIKMSKDNNNNNIN